jgi:hypothetical protein
MAVARQPIAHTLTGTIASLAHPGNPSSESVLNGFGFDVGDSFTIGFALDPAGAVDLNPFPNTGAFNLSGSPIDLDVSGHNLGSSGLFLLVQNDSACCPSLDFIRVDGAGTFSSSLPAPLVVYGLVVFLASSDLSTLVDGSFHFPTDLTPYDTRRLTVSIRNTADLTEYRITGTIALGAPSIEDQVEALIDTVTALGLGQGLTNSLNAKLGNAMLAIAGANSTGACGMLAAFSNQVRALSGQTFPASTADDLTAAASSILDVLGCS